MQEQELAGRLMADGGRLRSVLPAIENLFFKYLTRWRISLLSQLLDITLIMGLAILLFTATQRSGHFIKLPYFVGAVTIAGSAYYSFLQSGLYDIQLLMNPLRAIKFLCLRWTFIFMMMAALTALTHEMNLYSRLWFAGFYLSGIAVLSVQRVVMAKVIRAWIDRGHHCLSVAIVGGNRLAEMLIAHFKNNPWGVRIIGVFDDRGRRAVQHIAGVKLRGTIADLLEYSKNHEVDTVVLTLPLSASARMQAVLGHLRQQPLNVRVLPGAIGLERLSPIGLSRMELPGVQLISVADRPISDVQLFAKTAFDRAAALVLLFILAPVLLFCAVGVALSSPGPIFFQQKRIGYKGRGFNVLKFRTMHFSTAKSTELTARADIRIFKFGRFLRRFSLDELPQLINVLLGDMSLVGPRPHMPEARAAGRLYFDAVSEYADRQRVKPGMTGWAQINGWRGPTETIEQIERRVEHDIYYIENWSLFLDFYILMRTVVFGFYGDNAF
jgi:Undecaprenyl-phosphate glucose phosphotransferase